MYGYVCFFYFIFYEQSHLKVPFPSLSVLTGIVPLFISPWDLIGAHMAFLTSLALHWPICEVAPQVARLSGLQGVISTSSPWSKHYQAWLLSIFTSCPCWLTSQFVKVTPRKPLKEIVQLIPWQRPRGERNTTHVEWAFARWSAPIEREKEVRTPQHDAQWSLVLFIYSSIPSLFYSPNSIPWAPMYQVWIQQRTE